MANNYCQFSAALVVPKGRGKRAESIAARVAEELEKDEAEGCCGTGWSLEDEGSDSPHIWFRSDESGTPEHAEKIAKAILEELELDGAFVLSWAFTCSKLRLDEFGGGACVVRRGMETVWVDAASEAQKQAGIAT